VARSGRVAEGPGPRYGSEVKGSVQTLGRTPRAGDLRALVPTRHAAPRRSVPWARPILSGLRALDGGAIKFSSRRRAGRTIVTSSLGGGFRRGGPRGRRARHSWARPYGAAELRPPVNERPQAERVWCDLRARRTFASPQRRRESRSQKVFAKCAGSSPRVGRAGGLDGGAGRLPMKAVGSSGDTTGGSAVTFRRRGKVWSGQTRAPVGLSFRRRNGGFDCRGEVESAISPKGRPKPFATLSVSWPVTTATVPWHTPGGHECSRRPEAR